LTPARCWPRKSHHEKNNTGLPPVVSKSSSSKQTVENYRSSSQKIVALADMPYLHCQQAHLHRYKVSADIPLVQADASAASLS